jgi:hypothetical protein
LRKSFALLTALALSTALLSAGTSKEDAEAVARRFGAALTHGDAGALRPLLPARGKVKVTLDVLGEAQGSYGVSQVEALLREGLGRTTVRSFETQRVESDAATFALVRCRAAAVDRQGRTVRVVLHLSLQPEGGGWSVREIRESPE